MRLKCKDTLTRAALLILLCCACGCSSLKTNAYLPCNIPIDMQPAPRSKLVPIDHRVLGAPIPTEHKIAVGDVLGIYIADVIGEREELPQVAYPSFRTKNAPIEPFVGLPIKVELDGSIKLPYVPPLPVVGKTIPEVRDAIIEVYVDDTNLVQPGRENVLVSLITPAFYRIYVVRQDTRYNVPGLQRPDEFEISRRWSGTTLYLEPKEASVLTALMRSGGLPGIDAMNEIWVMKGMGEEVEKTIQFGKAISDPLDTESTHADRPFNPVPVVKKLVGNYPMMLPKDDSKLVRIPLHHDMDSALPFDPQDVVLGDGDVVFLPRRDGDHFMTGGFLPSGRFPLPRDRDLEILEAISICTGSSFGPNAGSTSPNYEGGGGGLVPPTDVFIVRRSDENKQIKIYVDLKKCLDDPCERVKIAPGDLIILRYKRKEMLANLALNLFNYNLGFTKVLGNDNRVIVP